jgi:hypothetical protein
LTVRRSLFLKKNHVLQGVVEGDDFQLAEVEVKLADLLQLEGKQYLKVLVVVVVVAVAVAVVVVVAVAVAVVVVVVVVAVAAAAVVEDEDLENIVEND